jgi:hypothetical protein
VDPIEQPSISSVQSPSSVFRVAYCLTLIALLLPFGLAGSSWVRMATGSNFYQALPILGPLLPLVFALYRIYLVIRHADTLDAPSITGVLRWVQVVCSWLIFLGGFLAIASVAAGPVMRLLITNRTESGAEFFVVGLLIAYVGSLNMFGLLGYELTRLVGFERQRRAVPVDAPSIKLRPTRTPGDFRNTVPVPLK